jgi:hypothetical protein
MARLTTLVAVFSVAFAVLFTGPAFLSGTFPGMTLMKNGDVLDLLTPLVLIPLYWLLLLPWSSPTIHARQAVAFAILAALWVEGQGMHLSANSIGHLLDSQTTPEAYRLTYFYDEVLSHFIWHLGIIGLSLLLVVRQRGLPPAEAGLRAWPFLLTGFLHGFVLFTLFIEGGTAVLGVPYAVGLSLFFFVTRARALLAQKPVWLFLAAASLTALILFAGWAAYWGGLPQFSQVGIIE